MACAIARPAAARRSACTASRAPPAARLLRSEWLMRDMRLRRPDARRRLAALPRPCAPYPPLSPS
jgi:hypothetical protein